LHIVAKRRYGLLVRVLAVHALGALALLALARTVHAVFDLGPWYLAKMAVLYALGTVLCVAFVEAHHPFPRYGPANLVTLIRGLLVALIAGLIGEAPMPEPALFAALLAATIAFLDGLDGRLARTSGMSSSFGARFDMETDSVLVLAMSILAWQHGKAGAWVLAIGLMRYAFAAAGKALPWLAGPLTPTMRGKTVAVVQMGVLSFTLAPFVPVPLSTAAAAISLAMLVWSFAIDIGRLWRQRSGA
jgi:phosphatidylglycerophosphate synthase